MKPFDKIYMVYMIWIGCASGVPMMGIVQSFQSKIL
jgi:hypothetical protein